MSITIQLYGTLGRYVRGYEAGQGLVRSFEHRTTVAQLVTHLGIPPVKVGIVTINGSMVDAKATVPDLCRVKIFQPIFGG